MQNMLFFATQAHGLCKLGQRAEEGRSRIAGVLFHNLSTGPRPDAISYCLDARERFEGMPQPEVQKIAFEIAMLGSPGLNDLEKIQILQYVGFQILDPTIDLSAEYQVALEIHRSK